MRTTLDIEDDVLQAAKELAQREGNTQGKIIFQLARRGLTASSPQPGKVFATRNGVPLLPSRGEVITLEHVRKLMDEAGI